MTHWNNLPTEILQRITIVTRTEGSEDEDYDDVPYTEATTLVNGIFQQVGGQDEAREDGRQLRYDARAQVSGSQSLDTDDLMIFQGNRYSILAIDEVYDGRTLDHKQVSLKRSV